MVDGLSPGAYNGANIDRWERVEMSFNIHQEVANYLAVRNRNRAQQEANEPLRNLPDQTAPEARPRWARLQAFLRGLAAGRSRPRPRSTAREVRPERG